MHVDSTIEDFVCNFEGNPEGNREGRPERKLLLVSESQQRLFVFESKTCLNEYPVSTAAKGLGCQNGSYQTPTGLHEIKEKIGHGREEGEIFIAREPQSECAVIERHPISTGTDAITSRILWLSGLEPGVNQGGDHDSFERYIYIHGTHEEGLIGKPASIGCIRMKNKDVIALFDQVSEGDYVYIMA